MVRGRTSSRAAATDSADRSLESALIWGSLLTTTRGGGVAAIIRAGRACRSGGGERGEAGKVGRLNRETGERMGKICLQKGQDNKGPHRCEPKSLIYMVRHQESNKASADRINTDFTAFRITVIPLNVPLKPKVPPSCQPG